MSLPLFPPLKGNGRVLAIDVDEVCADLHTAWLARYNLVSGDTLLPEDVHTWSIEKYVKTGWESKIFDILEEQSLCLTVTPMPFARTGISRLRAAGFRIVFVTACVPGTEKAKRDWLVHWGFLPESLKKTDFVVMYDKSLVRADYLFDDKPENVNNFPGCGVLMNRPHNYDAVTRCHRLNTLVEAYHFLWRRDRDTRMMAAEAAVSGCLH